MCLLGIIEVPLLFKLSRLKLVAQKFIKKYRDVFVAWMGLKYFVVSEDI